MHKDINTKKEREKAVVSEMIALYCRRQHGGKTPSARNARLLLHTQGRGATNAPLWRQRYFALIVRYTAINLK